MTRGSLLDGQKASRLGKLHREFGSDHMIRGASVIGREHVRLGRNNQDAWACAEHHGARTIVVADGCSSEPSSEVGAQLASRWLARWVAEHSIGRALEAQLAIDATRAMTAWLYRLAGSFEGDVPGSIQQYLLFTVLCATSFGGRTLVFGIGDGVVQVDERLMLLDSGPENTPSYMAYRLTGATVPQPQIHFVGKARRVTLMTDGLEPVAHRVSGLLADLGANPRGLQRRLNVFSEAERLSDDATIATFSMEA